MIMKHLIRHTSSLLRTAMLLGALAFVNIQPKAQTSEQLADLPSAFKFFTAEEVNTVIGDGKYYYIQFYQENLWADLAYTQNVAVFLADCGLNESLRTKDYLPFSDNLLWTFVPSGDGFKLKSKKGFFVGHITTPNNRYIACEESSAVTLKFFSRADGYEIGMASDDGNGMNRVSGNQWANVGNYGSDRTRTDPNNLLRVGELKPNVAHIIYYRGEGVDNINYNSTTTRHYLTNSGSNRVSWSPAVDNGNLEGNNTNSFSVAQPGSEIQNATITDNIGCSRGIRITSAGNSNNGWDSQFFITANEVIPQGTTFHLEFDYKASTNVNDIHVQAHAVPSDNSYIGYNVPITDDPESEVSDNNGNMSLNFTTEWQHFERDITVTEGMSTGSGHTNSFQSLVFDLWKNNSSYDYYFDNIVFTVGGTSVINNGSLEGANSNNFFSKVYGDNNGDPQPATIAYGFGCSRGISIYSPGNETNQWDTQFFIRANDIVPIETTIHVEFDYRATQNATVPTQSQGVPGAYHSTNMINNLYFTTEWQHYSGDIDINNNMGGTANDFQTIAFNLGRNNNGEGGEITYFFDNIIFNVPITHDVSSRQSIIPSDMSLWSLPTAAAYHQDGLWLLEKADDDGTFYIKKYGSEKYMNAEATGLSDLGEKNASLGTYKLEDPSANRYTRIQNMKYETAALAANMFYKWNGYDGNAVQGDQANVDFQLGTMLSDGAVVAGSGNVDYLLYANLTGYTKMIIEGTPGVQVRVLMNRQESNNGPLTERDVTLGEDGKGEVVLTDLSYVHLNAIKIGWGSSGEIGIVTLVDENSGVPSSPNYLNYSAGDGSPVYQINNDPDRDWYAGFYPVEVPIPNKDEFFQVIVKVNSNGEMLNHTGGTSTYTEEIDTRELWILEQVDDYKHYRLKDPKTGRYFRGNDSMTDPNESNNAETNPNSKFWTDFSIKWFFTGPLVKKIVVNHYVTHKISYLQQHAQQFANSGLDLELQGLVTEAQSDWWNYEKETQKVNQFEITHYVKYNEEETYLLPTAQNTNDHTMYQRWYNYNDETDLASIQSHVTLNGRDGASVPYYLYKNGLVTGQRVYWGDWNIQINDDNRAVWNWSFLDAGQTPYAYTTFTYKNIGGDSLTVAADVSRYSDMTYENPESPLEGNLEEPSLTMRYIYYMKDAREMAAKLTKTEYTFKGDLNEENWLTNTNESTNTDTDNSNWMEWKVFHFPSRQLAYEKDKAVGYRGEFIGLRHRFSDYWIFNNSTPDYDSKHPTEDDRLNDHLIHGSTSGNIVVKIYDPNGTGIRLGGYNPSIDLKSGTTWATPAAQVGDIIRVNIKDRATGTNEDPDFNHGHNCSLDDNEDLGINHNHLFHHSDYSEWELYVTEWYDDHISVEIQSGDLSDLQSNGLRFQGIGFTITSVELIHNDVSTTIWIGNTVFDDWGDSFTIDKSKFTGVENTSYNEGDDGDYRGFYYHDLMYPWANNGIDEYGSSRFLVFRYPESGKVLETNKEVYLRAYFVDPNDRSRIFQLAQYTIIFDKDEVTGEEFATLPWTSVNGDKVQGTHRDPNQLREKAGKPIAQITFDYPTGSTYHFPEGYSNHGQNTHDGENYGYVRDEPYVWPDPNHTFDGTIPDSSPIPLNFDKSNYAFDGENALFGAYAMLSSMDTQWGNRKDCVPADHATYGYNIAPDEGYNSGFLYIDASELPGDICSTPFVGDFCAGDHLMVSGWISGANNVKNGSGVPDGRDGDRSPGGITLTLKGEHNLHNADGTIKYDENGKPMKETVTLYRFCPGMCYELDNGRNGPDGIDGDHVVWQQFYFEFEVGAKYDRHWLEVNNNCVSSQGGDFMLDNIEVYCIVPEVEPSINTPLCVSVGEDGETVTEMRLLELNVDYNKLKSSKKLTSGYSEIGFVFLDKYKFLEKFRSELSGLSNATITNLHLGAFDFDNISLDQLADAIKDGEFDLKISNSDFYSAYKNAFDAAILGNPVYDGDDNLYVWHSDSPTQNMNASVMYFRWGANFEDNEYMPLFNFADAVNKKKAVFRQVVDGEKFIVMNGNYPGLKWKTNTEYYIIPSNAGLTEDANVYEDFNLCSMCSMASTFLIEPPLEVLGLDAVENTEDLVVCDGQVPTLLTNLKGYDINGKEVKMKNLNFDWWLGKKGDKTTTPETPPVPATLDNYHAQYKLIDENEDDVKANRIYLAYALSVMRAYYPDATSLDGIKTHEGEDEALHLTDYMINYLREVVDAGELVLHQSAISVPAEHVLDSDPYFYLVACPIHDEAFLQALNPSANEYVTFYCDEPQGVRIKLGQKAPKLQTGFVPYEHGFNEYNYNFPANTNPVLSIRLAKAAQFETVKNTEAEVADVSTDVNYLWLPIRNAQTETAQGVIKMSDDDNIYLAASNDLTWDKKISQEMNKYGSLPVVGRIVQLQAVNTKDNSEGAQPGATINTDAQDAYNRLAVYFNKDFNVREGYNYTLSLPFQEDPDPETGEDVNVCSGTILINLKIVPDYEVWTGAAGNIDWNNDENWRRADGNTNTTITNNPINKGVYGDELYRANGAVDNEDSPLYKYTTNKDNYYSSSKKANARPSSDQILRKGFAPLYCTHVLMKNDEWGNAPELYDALDYKVDPDNSGYKPSDATLNAYPFPNLRETSTPILKFDMQARRYDMWYETYGVEPDRGVSTRPKDLIAEMYQINSCDEIAFQPGTELMNAHLLNYNTAWVEYQLDNKRWYLLGSPLQGTISGEWYAPTGTAKQKTTYYDPVSFVPRYVKVVNPKATDNPSERGWYIKNGENYVRATETEIVSETDYYYLTNPCEYDRYSPAIYQRSWDKAKAVLYEIGSTYDKDDDKQDANLGTEDEGIWSSGNIYWPAEGGTADEYLDRLGYKPFGQNKANVAIKGIWSNTYNDAQVDYATGGFSVMVMNHLKNNDQSGEIVDQSTNEKRYSSIVRLPKEDMMYDYYEFSQNNENDGGTDTELSDVRTKNRAKNRGRLKTDNLLPERVEGMTYYTTPRKTEATVSIYGDQRTYTRVPTIQEKLQEMNGANYTFTEIVPAGISDLGFYLVENPFPCGLDMDKFFKANKDVLEAKYWLLTATGQHLVQKAEDTDEWISPDEPGIEYPNPNYVAPDSGDSSSDDPSSSDSEPTEPETLKFYPNAVVAPGQGFFVQAKSGTSGDLTVTFNRDMQAQSRFGMIEGEGTTYEIVVGQSQEMRPLRKLIDTDGDGIPDTEDPNENSTEYETIDVDLNGNGIYGELQITIGEGDDAKTVDEIEYVMVPVYEEIEDPDNPEETIKIPLLEDITEKVVIYKYVPETMTIPDDESTTEVDESGTIGKEYPLRARTRSSESTNLAGLVITAKRGTDQSSTLVMQREQASNDFLPSEDTEVFVTSDLEHVPTVYTLCGRLATTINSIHDFRSLPLGVESSSDAPCTLTFKGVEMLGDSISFYDALKKELTPLESGMKFVVSGQTQNRYYLVRSLIKEEAAAETHIQIFTEGLTAKVIASTGEPITNVRCYDTAGRLIHSASPQTPEYSFSLPIAGIYIICAETENDRKTVKLMAK